MSDLTARQPDIGTDHDAPAPAPTPATAQDISNASHVPSSASGDVPRSFSNETGSATSPNPETYDAIITSHLSSHGSKSSKPPSSRTRSSTSRHQSSGTVKSPDGLESGKRPSTSSSRGPGCKRARVDTVYATSSPGSDMSDGHAASSPTQASDTVAVRSGTSTAVGHQTVPASLTFGASSSIQPPWSFGSSPTSDSMFDSMFDTPPASPPFLPAYLSFRHPPWVTKPSRKDTTEVEVFPSLITPKLPNEVFRKIIDYLGRIKDLTTLAKLMSTSRAAYGAVAPTLYNEVVITRKNARSFYLGLPEHVRRPVYNHHPTGITWEEFKDPKHDFECKAAIKARANPDSKNRKHVSVWPYADIDSDDDDELEHGNGSDIDVPYVTDLSIQRKSKLLALVERLCFEEIPTTAVCLKLARNDLLNLLPKMSKLKKVSLRPKAVWQMIDWNDRHLDHKTPFDKYLSSLPAKHLCIQLPVLDQHLEKSYMSRRIVTAEQHAYRDRDMFAGGGAAQHGYLRRRFERLMERYLLRLCGDVGSHLRGNLVVHNCVRGLPDLPLRLDTCRTFYRPCVCRDGSVIDKIDDGYCYQHPDSNPLRNHRIDPIDLPSPDLSLPDSLAPPGLNLLELVDFDWRSGTIDNATRENVMVERLKAGIASKDDSRKEFLQRVVKFKDSTEVEPCECCGNKQLTYEQSSIKFFK